jgi:hypothetical protein
MYQLLVLLNIHLSLLLLLNYLLKGYCLWLLLDCILTAPVPLEDCDLLLESFFKVLVVVVELIWICVIPYILLSRVV